MNEHETQQLDEAVEAVHAQECIGCGQPATKSFYCPCDLTHGICDFHAKMSEIRKDCCHTDTWPENTAAKTLLLYVIEYLAEEAERQPHSLQNKTWWVETAVKMALDAYAGGAR